MVRARAEVSFAKHFFPPLRLLLRGILLCVFVFVSCYLQTASLPIGGIFFFSSPRIRSHAVIKLLRASFVLPNFISGSRFHDHGSFERSIFHQRVALSQ